MARIRDDSWTDDVILKECLIEHVRQCMQRIDILDYLRRDFNQYAWSMRSLERRLTYFGIKYTDAATTVGAVQQAVQEELQGPGKLLGYRAMHQKIRQIHKLNVPRDLVYDIMSHLDSAGLQERAVGKNQKAKGHFIIGGVNQVHSLDGHDKVMGYQNNTFPWQSMAV